MQNTTHKAKKKLWKTLKFTGMVVLDMFTHDVFCWYLMFLCSSPLSVSLTREGTHSLTEHDAVRLLGGLRCLDQRPAFSTAAPGSGPDVASFTLPTPMERHHQLLIPALRLIVAMLQAAPEHPQLNRDTLIFVRAHDTVISAVLQRHQQTQTHAHAPTPFATASDLSSLIALEVVTSILYHLYHGPCYRSSAKGSTVGIKQRIPDLRSPQHKMDATKRGTGHNGNR